MRTQIQVALRNCSTRRLLYTSSSRWTAYSPQPAPPRLPKEEQEIFEQLQKQSMGAFSTPRKPPQINQSPQSNSSSNSSMSQNFATETNDADEEVLSIRADVKKGDELHPNVRRGAAAEFEGHTNPDTGEIGGPKNNPIRWKEMEGDWSFNGRVSDF